MDHYIFSYILKINLDPNLLLLSSCRVSNFHNDQEFWNGDGHVSDFACRQLFAKFVEQSHHKNIVEMVENFRNEQCVNKKYQGSSIHVHLIPGWTHTQILSQIGSPVYDDDFFSNT